MNLTYKNNFWGYFSFYYRIVGNRLFLYLGLSILISFMDGMGLAMFIPLLQSLSDGGKAGAGGESLGHLNFVADFITSLGFELNIVTVLSVLVILFVLKGFFKYIQLLYYAMLRHYFIKTVRYKLVNNLAGLSYGAFLKMDAGKIQNTLTADVARLFNTMTLYFGASQIFVMLCTYIVLAFLANYQFAILVVVGSALSNLVYRKIFKTTKKASIELSKKGSDFNSYLIQAITYFKYLKSTNTFSSYAKKLKKVIDEAELLNRKIGHMKAIANSVKEPIIITVVALVIFAQISWMGTNLNTILLSLVLFYRALSFLVALQNEWHGFIENIGGMNAVSGLSEQMILFQEPKGLKKFKNIEHSMQIRDVEFFYDSKKALSNINIDIPAKHTIALVGESGSGKTTLANMVAGLITPNEGGIYIDDVRLTDVDLNSYRDKIGYISQESVIFNDSIFNNITFWADYNDENKKRFDEIIRMTSLSEFVASQPDKEFTNLGDNGILISGGQKQRISIARELFKKAEILIFDEATSALDSETEKIIQDNIEKLHGNHTMIVIAHRLSTIKKADIIFLLEGGKVTASGTFEEMVHKSSRFKKMVSLQAV